MYKKAVITMVLINLLFLVSFLFIKSLYLESKGELNLSDAISIIDEELIADKDTGFMGIADITMSKQRVVDLSVIQKEDAKFRLSEEDIDVLCRIVEAEAGGEDADGKLLVANVVLNRVLSDDFPETVKDVVFQEKNGVAQFSPISNGSYFHVMVSDETLLAVERALEGEDISEGALYFVARDYAKENKLSWFDEHLNHLFAHGGHEFYTSNN